MAFQVLHGNVPVVEKAYFAVEEFGIGVAAARGESKQPGNRKQAS